MSIITVVMSLDARKQLKVVPDPVVVRPEDEVLWTSPDGPLTVEFPRDVNPFNGTPVFTSASGSAATNHGIVRRDVARPKHFACTVTLGGHVFHRASGVDVPGE